MLDSLICIYTYECICFFFFSFVNLFYFICRTIIAYSFRCDHAHQAWTDRCAALTAASVARYAILIRVIYFLLLPFRPFLLYFQTAYNFFQPFNPLILSQWSFARVTASIHRFVQIKRFIFLSIIQPEPEVPDWSCANMGAEEPRTFQEFTRILILPRHLVKDIFDVRYNLTTNHPRVHTFIDPVVSFNSNNKKYFFLFLFDQIWRQSPQRLYVVI